MPWKGNDPECPLTIKISGTANSSKSLKLPFELAKTIKDWYYLNGGKI
jgi:hypothetical protein